jgi:hypothetical protein
MQGIVSGGLLVVAFAAMAGLALIVTAQLYRISGPARSPGQPPGQATARQATARQATARPGEPPDAS